MAFAPKRHSQGDGHIPRGLVNTLQQGLCRARSPLRGRPERSRAGAEPEMQPCCFLLFTSLTRFDREPAPSQDSAVVAELVDAQR